MSHYDVCVANLSNYQSSIQGGNIFIYWTVSLTVLKLIDIVAMYDDCEARQVIFTVYVQLDQVSTECLLTILYMW